MNRSEISILIAIHVQLRSCTRCYVCTLEDRKLSGLCVRTKRARPHLREQRPKLNDLVARPLMQSAPPQYHNTSNMPFLIAFTNFV